ncbi:MULTISPECIES: hypothetical protein [Burkholderia]|jgi:hypothetical protein|uniref:hypothetical protein n=1 Tax=Burkholderia TaxID=32008 RepID=UPI000D00FF41|nr:hypothetical protein [Burkholderia ambifaria]MDP9581381.1 hypothetical protein [Burkholderia contaminans]MBR8183977.1 hypothetical protein [Burkholderia ambifaria]MBR8220299.1 hypothetical protein [Burkholderia ambifaria]NHL68113.1 hypothetical protein [Burkholderia ambifaria]PRG06378.1 hypothetical protein C6Q14_11740 [Burkholderia ambifaria]
MNIVINDTAWLDEAPGMADIRPVEHKSSQIGAGPQYVADVLGRFGADSTDTSDAAPVVLGYN